MCMYSKFIIILSVSFLSHQMLHQQYHSLMANNRRLERNLSRFSHTVIQNEPLYSCIIDGILQISDLEGLKKSTKFLAKKSIDTYVVLYPNWCGQELRKAAVSFLLMAVKVNEDPILYQKLTIKWYLNQFQSAPNPAHYQELINFELQIYSLAQFNLNFTTPYDYLSVYKEMFFLDQKLIKQLTYILDFSLTIPQLIFNTGEQLFVGSLLMIWGKKKQDRKQWILNLALNKQRCQEVADVISQTYQSELQLASSEC